MSLELGHSHRIKKKIVSISNTDFVLNSAGDITADKTAQVSEAPLKTPAAAPQVESVTCCSVGLSGLFLFVVVVFC